MGTCFGLVLVVLVVLEPVLMAVETTPDTSVGWDAARRRRSGLQERSVVERSKSGLVWEHADGSRGQIGRAHV